MSDGGGVTINLSSFWASILATVLAALCITGIYGADTLRTAVADNTRNTQQALAMIRTGQDERDELRARMTTVETRLAIWEDRMKRRTGASDALWRPPMPLPNPGPRDVQFGGRVAYHKSPALGAYLVKDDPGA